MQETFSYLLRKFPGFRLSARMTTFLYPVVKNLSISIARQRKREAGQVSLIEAIASPIVTPQAERSELAAAMATLPDTHREVMLMRFVDDMSVNEIAVALAIPEGTVKSRLHHAILALRSDPRMLRYFK
jgi:RNA polymerase sigma-70 factor (ECF subfamily)